MPTIKKEIAGYLIVGIIGFTLDTLCFFYARQWGISILVSQWIGASVGAIHNQLWHHYAVFDHSQHIGKTSFYSLILLIVSIAISGPLLLAIQTIISHLLISKILLIGIITLVGFSIKKCIIFTKRNDVPVSE